MILPLLEIQPIPNANRLERTLFRIDEAFNDRNFVCDLNHYALQRPSPKTAFSEFQSLFNPQGGFASYYEFLSETPFALPVVRSRSDEHDLAAEAARIESLGRRPFVHLRADSSTDLNFVRRGYHEFFPEAIYWLDAGWGMSLDDEAMRISNTLRALTEFDVNAEIVVTSSTFPDSFTNIGARGECPIVEQTIFRNVRASTNAERVYYGDWASTRPPSSEERSGPTPPRIDLPISDRWVMFRAIDTEGYQEVAARAVSDGAWPDDLSIWGTHAIEATAIEAPGGISGQLAAAAARINIHMHVQANRGDLAFSDDEDEPFDDE